MIGREEEEGRERENKQVLMLRFATSHQEKRKHKKEGHGTGQTAQSHHLTSKWLTSRKQNEREKYVDKKLFFLNK